ncbi:MAG: HypC/HybG/HupF family hydrogenase formation chaperone, partial [Candidatus Thiodiazotropha taylori]
MCIGIPMQVVSMEGTTALCQGMGESRRVDTLLVGDQPVGSWLLVF